MTLTFKRVKANQQAKYLGQRSLNSKVIVQIHNDTHAHHIDCFKVVDDDLQ